jgi:hypothetical protein
VEQQEQEEAEKSTFWTCRVTPPVPNGPANKIPVIVTRPQGTHLRNHLAGFPMGGLVADDISVNVHVREDSSQKGPMAVRCSNKANRSPGCEMQEQGIASGRGAVYNSRKSLETGRWRGFMHVRAASQIRKKTMTSC